MNKKMEAPQKQPTIVARLMGLEALPNQHSVPITRKIEPKKNIENVCTIGKAIYEHHQQGSINCSRTVPNSWNINSQIWEKRKPKHGHEVKKKHPKNCDTSSGPLSMGKCSGKTYQQRMAFVHQKFIEAKRLARNEHLLQSTEFQNALEVLSSNCDLFLKFLEEPNPWFSKDARDMQPHQLTNNNCITVLKPSKMTGEHIERQSKGVDPCVKANAMNKVRQHKGDSTSHPTRIVVLKPNPGKSYDMMKTTPLPSSCCRFPERGSAHEEVEDHGVRSSREAAKEITRGMQERLGIYRRDEILLTSTQSKRYRDGGNSLNASLNECMEEDLSDSFSQLKIPQHSGDLTDRCASPCSFSSLSQASYSPQSSVIREARKRLSERWVLASNGRNLKNNRHCGSYTLGKMLADPQAKKGLNESPTIVHGRISSGNHDQGGVHAKADETSSAMNVLPISRSARASDHSNQIGRTMVTEDAKSLKSTKSPLKGKISGLFSSKDKSTAADQYPSSSVISPYKSYYKECDPDAKRSILVPECILNTVEGPQHNYEEILKKNLSSTLEQDSPKEGTPSTVHGFASMGALAFDMARLPESSVHNAEQPSPVSVLEASFSEKELNRISTAHPKTVSAECSRVTSRDSSIETLACSLSWDEDDFMGTRNLKHHLLNSPEDTEEGWVLFVQQLLASSGLGSVASGALVSKLTSLDSPLDPLLLKKCVEPKREGAKLRQRRSFQRLLFDYANSVLLNIVRDELASNHRSDQNVIESVNLTDMVLMQMKESFPTASKEAPIHPERVDIILDSIMWKQVRGKEWEETERSEITEVAGEIAGHVLDELSREILDGWY